MTAGLDDLLLVDPSRATPERRTDAQKVHAHTEVHPSQNKRDLQSMREFNSVNRPLLSLLFCFLYILLLRASFAVCRQAPLSSRFLEHKQK